MRAAVDLTSRLTHTD